MLTRESILAADDLPSRDVDVKEWGGSVRVRVMTGAERDAFGASLVGEDGKPDMSQYGIKMLVRCIVGDDGQPMFSLSDLEALGKKSAVALRRVFEAADALNSLGEDQIAAAEKN